MATTTPSKRLLTISADSVSAFDTMTYGGLNVATEQYVSTQVSNLVASAPGTLDTLNELAAALGDDPNFATTITNSIATKLDASVNPLKNATVSNDTITFTRADGTTFAITTSDANTNYYLNGITKSGNTLTFAVTGAANQTYTFGSNAFTSYTDHSTQGYLTAHPNITAATSVNNSGRTYIQDITVDSNGHVTGITSATETVVNTDTNYYVDGLSFDTATGVLTASVNGTTNQTVDLDGRYQLAGTYNTIIGTDTDINTSGATIIDNIFVTDGVITSMGTRTLSPADIGAATSGHNHDGVYFKYNSENAGFLNLAQNTVGTTYGDTVSTVPSYYFGQKVGDNDGWRLYGEAPASNDVKMIFEIIDDIESGDTWVFRNKKTYSPYNANDVVVIGGDGTITTSGRLYIQTVDTSTSATGLVLGAGGEVEKRTLGSNAFTSTNIPQNVSELTNDAGYITDGNTNWNNSYGFITASDSITGSSASAAKLTDGGGLTTQPGTNNLIFTGQINAGTTGLFATSDNSNAIITLNRHSGNYDSQLGFSSNGNIYYRKFSNSTAFTTQAWLQVWHSGNFSQSAINNWTSAYNWGNHASAGYLTSFDITTQTDPKYLRSNAADTATGLITFSGGINGFTNSAGISGSNFNITGVNQITINDPGEGIVWTGGSSGDITLATLDDSTDSILNVTGTNASLAVNGAKVATESYVGTQISNLVASAPATLDTLNELAAALGDDANFSTTMSTALGNRLRVDTASQGLTATQQSNARTNLGLGTAATSATGDFATASHTHSTATTSANGFMSSADKTKLDGIASGAEVNVQSDWNATSGDAFILNKPTIPSGSQLVKIYNNVDYVISGDINERGNYGAGVTVYEGYSGGANRPHTYDTTAQFMSTASQGFELSIDWVSNSTTPLKIRSLRDCCQGWSPWRDVAVAEDGLSGTFYFNDSIHVGSRITHAGDTDTYVQFDANRIRFIAGGVTKFDSNNTYVTTSGYNNSNWDTAYSWGNHASAGYLTTVAFGDITGTPTTIAGYGITDAFDGAYSSLTGKPTLGTLAALSSVNAATITDNSVGAAELNVSGNGSSGQVLTSDGDGTFSWTNKTTNTDTNYYLDGITKSGNTLTFSVNGTTNQSYAFGSNAFTSYTDHSTQGYLTTVAFGDITGTPTTLSGYGITDAFDGSYSSLTGVPSTFAPSAHTHDDRYYTETEMKTFFKRGYIESNSATNLAIGWYTIATNTGDRALGEFQIWDTASGDHQSVLFSASHHYGNDNSNDITVLAQSRYSGTNFRHIRIKDGGTYDGAALQVYIDASSNQVVAAITGANAQSSGWVLKDWVADATDPGDLSNYSSFGERCRIDLDVIMNGGIATTGEIYAGGATTQYRVLTTNDEGSGNGLDADTLDGNQGSHYLDYNNFTNTPSIPVSGTDFDPVGTDNSTNVTLNTTSYDYLSISGQEITLGQIDYSTDIANTPTLGTAAASAATDFVAVTGDTMSGKLTLNGDLDLVKSSGNNALTINSSGGGNPVIYMTSPTRGWGQFVNGTDLWFKDETGNIVTMVLEAGGNVGIGTTSPSRTLSVETTDTATYDSTVNASEISVSRKNSSNTAGQVAAISLNATGWSGSTTGVVVLNAIQRQGNFSNADFAIQNRVGGSFVETFRITTYGDVGIGTDSPSTKLHIADDANENLIIKLEQNNADKQAWFEANSQDGGFARFGIGADASDFAFWNTDQSAYHWYSGTLKMVLQSGGNLGVGVSNPLYKLDVDGTIHVRGESGTLIRAIGSNNTDQTIIRISNGNGNDISDYGFSIRYMGARSGNLNSLSIFSDNQAAASQVEAVTIAQDGIIGFSNSNPQATVDVGGTLKASGVVTLSNYASGLLQVDASGVVSVDSSTYLTGIAANSVGITELNVTDGTSGQVLTTDGNGTLSFTTVSASGANYYLDGITRTASTNTLVFSVNGTTDQSYTFGANAFTDTAIPVSGTDFDPVGTDNSTNVTLASVTGNYLSISGQEITAGTVPVSLGGTGATTAADARTNLGVDPAGTDNSTDVSLVTTAASYLSISGQAITLAKVKLSEINGGATAGILATNTSGVLSVDTSTYLTEVAFSDLTSTPTTLSGYGITDADNYGSWSIQNSGGTATAITSGKHIRFDGSSISGAGTSADPYVVDLSSINTDTQYTAGSGLTLNSNSFSVNGDLSGVTYIIGRDTNDKYVVNTTNHAWYLDGTLDMRLDSSGNLDVDGDVIAFSTVTNSDRRLKTDISTIENASEKVSKLRGVEYTWDYGKHKGKRDIGLIAQEVEEVVPEVVSEGELLDGTTAKRVDYAKLVGLLIEANKELQNRVEQLEKKLDGFTK